MPQPNLASRCKWCSVSLVEGEEGFCSTECQEDWEKQGSGDIEDEDDDDDPDYGDGHDFENDDRSMFADPGGKSALRAASASNPRNLPCGNCGAENVLTPADKRLGYCCDRCADRAESGMDY